MPQICLSDKFSNIDVLKDTCHQYAIEGDFELKTLCSSTPTRCKIACKDRDCGWGLRASIVANTSIFRICSVEREDDCYGLHHESNKEVTALFLSQYIVEKLKDQPGYLDIVKDVKHDWGIKITYSKAYRAKDEASTKINGTQRYSYSLLPKYCKGIEENNPGSLAHLETTESKFKEIFICYSASAEGFACILSSSPWT
jgi:zinc finger SWIM domain-containing protein 3